MFVGKKHEATCYHLVSKTKGAQSRERDYMRSNVKKRLHESHWDEVEVS